MKDTRNTVPAKSSYNHAISFARLLAMVFIVVCHFFQYYDHELAWWFNVGVQMFFCISGFLYANKKIPDPIAFLSKNFRKILVPYYCFLIPTIVLYFLFARDSITVFSVAKAVLCCGTVDGIAHLWFVGYILFCYLITPLLAALADKLKDVNLLPCIGLFVLFLGVGQALFIGFSSYFNFSRISCYIIGYFLAFLLKNYGTTPFKRVSYLIIAACLPVNAVKIYLEYFSTATFPGIDFFKNYAHVLLGVSIFLLIYMFGSRLPDSRAFRLSDTYSYYIYLVHQLLILSPFTLMRLTPYAIVNGGIVILAIGVLAVILKYIADNASALTARVTEWAKHRMSLNA